MVIIHQVCCYGCYYGGYTQSDIIYTIIENDAIQEEADASTNKSPQPLTVLGDMEEEYVSQAPVNVHPHPHPHTVYQTLNDMNRKTSHRQSDAWETVRSKSPDAASFLQDADKFPMYDTYLRITC